MEYGRYLKPYMKHKDNKQRTGVDSSIDVHAEPTKSSLINVEQLW